MASLLQLANRPRLQLLLLMLFLLAGLFPEKAFADEVEPAGEGSGSEGVPALTVNGTATAIKCYSQNDECKAGEKKCLQPDFDEMEQVTCEGGYCSSDTTLFEDGSSQAERGCPDDKGKWVDCAKGKPDSCVVGDSTPEENKKVFEEFEKCVQPKEGKPGPEKKIKNSAYCVCDMEKCNTRTGSTSGVGPTGGKQLGYSVALVGALLVSIFPLRTLFLVG